MPIRINLLAEQLEAEEQRRRDPAKRALWIAGFVVGLLVVWAGYLQLKVVRADRQVAGVEAQFKQFEARYSQVRTNQNQVVEITRRIDALQRLATNRFLWGTPLDALQFTVVPNVQLVRFKTEQTHTVTDASKPVTNASGVVKVTPASAKETILMKIDARDFSANAGDQIPRFLEVLNNHPCFQTNLMKAELTGRTALQTEPGESSSPFVLFTVDCKYPERMR
jgi:uncharacterized membrane protein YciS (DUF1049 family)